MNSFWSNGIGLIQAFLTFAGLLIAAWQIKSAVTWNRRNATFDTLEKFYAKLYSYDKELLNTIGLLHYDDKTTKVQIIDKFILKAYGPSIQKI